MPGSSCLIQASARGALGRHCATGAGEKRFYPQRGISHSRSLHRTWKTPEASAQHNSRGRVGRAVSTPELGTQAFHLVHLLPHMSQCCPDHPSSVAIFLAEMNALPSFSTGWDPTHPLTLSSSNSASSVKPSPPAPRGQLLHPSSSHNVS